MRKSKETSNSGLLKRFVTVAMLAVMTVFVLPMTSSAQTAISKAKFTDNVYIGVSGTVATALKFDPFLPVEGDVSVRLGKWVTPALGFNIEETMGFGTPSLWMYYLKICCKYTKFFLYFNKEDVKNS